MVPENDPVAKSTKCLDDCKSYLLQATDTDGDLLEDIYPKILDSINQAISYRPRSVELHLEKAGALESLGYTCLQRQARIQMVDEIFHESLVSYERAMELNPSVWGEIEERFVKLRLKVSSMACCLFCGIEGASIYDSIAIDIGGRSYFICATSDSNVYVVDVVSGVYVATLQGHEGPVTTVTISADGQKVLTGSLDMTACVWNMADLAHALPIDGNKKIIAPQAILKGHTNRINCIVCTPCNTRAISSSTDNTLRIWDIATGECLGRMSGHSSLVSSISLSASGDVCASASGDASCRLWKIPEGECYEEIAWESGPVVLCEFLPFSSHGEYLMTAHAQLVQQEARILLWDVFDKETGWVDGKLSAPSMSINELRGRPVCTDSIHVKEGEFEDCTLLTCSCSDGMVHIWDISDTPLKLESFSLEERGVSIPDDIPAWSASSLRHASNKLNLVKFSPSGKFLAASRSSSFSLVIWDVENGTVVCQFFGHTKPIRKILWASDYKIFSFSEDQSIRGWKIRES